MTRMKAHSILVVEDSFEDFETISEAAKVADPSVEVIRACDAYEAESILAQKSSQSDSPFSLMILDYNLPGKNGREFLMDFSRFPSRHLTPVVVFTTSSSLLDCRECYEAGANAYHTKSVNYGDCLRTLNGIFNYWLKGPMLPLTDPLI